MSIKWGGREPVGDRQQEGPDGAKPHALARRRSVPAENGESGKCVLVGMAHGQKHCPVSAIDRCISTAVEMLFEHHRRHLAGWVSLVLVQGYRGVESTRATRCEMQRLHCPRIPLPSNSRAR